MALFGKKKTTPAPARAKPAAIPEAKGSIAAEEKKPYVSESKEEIHEVEKNIDYFLEKKSGLGILDRYKDKYGEDLDVPDVTAGVRYKYDYIEVEEIKEEPKVEPGKTEAKPAEKKGGLFGFGKKAEPVKAEADIKVDRGPYAMPPKPPKVKAKTTVPGEKLEAPTKEEKPQAPSFFAPDRPISGNSVGLALAGYPLFPFVGLLKYKARNPPETWMKVVVGIAEFPIVLVTIWFRIFGWAGYKAYKSMQKRKAERALEEAEMAEKRRAAREKRLAAGEPDDDYDDYDEMPRRRGPPPRRAPPRGKRRRRPSRA